MDVEIDVNAYAVYHCLRTASITDLDTIKEIQFLVPIDIEWFDEYTIHWNGSCVLEHLYAPNGSDVLELERRAVYGSFKWGFVYLSFRPRYLASQYGFQWAGVWRIQMRTVDPDAPSLYAPHGFCVSIQYDAHFYKKVNLQVGDSLSLDFSAPPFWYTGEVSIYYVNADSNQVEIKGALLDSSFEYDHTHDSGWYPFAETVTITNIWTQTLTLEMWWSIRVFRNVYYEANGQGLRFFLDPSLDPSKCTSLRITATDRSLRSYTVCTPNLDRAKEIYRISDDQYYTPQVINGVYELSLDPSLSWNVLENGVLGTWYLSKGPLARFKCSTMTPIVGEQVIFDGTTSTPHLGRIISYAWDFGDGSSGEGAVVHHSYSEPGSYNVTLTVTDSIGLKNTTRETVNALMHDVIVESVIISTDEIYIGQSIEVQAVIRNIGNFTEMFDITAYANNTTIQKKTISSLLPGNNISINFIWNTTGIVPGYYRFIIEASTVPDETCTTDNIRSSYIISAKTDSTPPDIESVSIMPKEPEYGNNVTIIASVIDRESGLDTVILGYSNGSTWNYSIMVQEGQNHKATISAMPYGFTVQYKIQVTDNVGNLRTSDIYAYTVSDKIAPQIDNPTTLPDKPSGGFIFKEDVTVDIIVNEPAHASGVKNVTLLYRAGRGEWQAKAMVLRGNEWTSTIPAQNAGTYVEYYIESYDNAGNSAATDTYSYIPEFPFMEAVIWFSIALVLLVIVIYLVKYRK